MFQRYRVYWYRNFPSLGSVLSINDPGLERGSVLIRLYDMNRRLADIEMIDGVIRIVSYDGDWVERSLESVRKCYSPRTNRPRILLYFAYNAYTDRFARSTLRVDETRLRGPGRFSHPCS
jgi:hypothetical protein